MPKEVSRYGFVLRNQTNLNRRRIGESQANPESRVAGHLGRMPKEASRYGFVLRNQTNLNGPRIGESTDRGISGESCEPGGRTESTDHGISGES